MKKSFLSMLLPAICLSASAVTFNVTVPAGTRSCYISGDFQGWSAGNAVEMQKDGDNHFTLTLNDVTEAQVANGFKYLSGPDWKYVEKDANGGEISNRTVATANDVVGSWASLYNSDIKTAKLMVNGYERAVKIALPDGYEESNESYPVVYYLGVSQRYSKGGDDNSNDDFFGEYSWNAYNSSLANQAATGQGVIMVSVKPFVAECMAEPHPDYMGSGEAEAFTNGLIANVLPYIEQTYRVKSGAESRSIVGADLGGMLALYIAANRPDLFGKCLSMSPMLTLNNAYMLTVAAKASANQRYILTYGTSEPGFIKEDVEDFAGAMSTQPSVVALNGATHNDVNWGNALVDLFPFFTQSDFSVPTTLSVKSQEKEVANIKPMSLDLSSASLSYYYGENTESLTLDSNAQFVYVPAYVNTDGTTEPALVYIKDVSSSFKGTSYWNVKDNATGNFLSSSNQKVSFSSKKSNRSWLLAVVKADGSIKKLDASCQGFRAVAADATVSMKPDVDTHHASATVTFTGADKSFTIHYGSVNSESDMGAVTGTLSVSDNCIEAILDYDFYSNSVNITETKWGETFDNVVITEFSALPSVTYAGQSSRVTLRLATDCTPKLTSAYNYGSASPVPLVADGPNTWHADFSGLKEGIYHLTISASKGNNTKDNVAQIAIKVISQNENLRSPKVGVNAYEGVDWDNVGRYKANFHTHTSQSFDTQFTTTEVVDLYHGANYQILALTDHDINSYPWTMFNLFNPAAEDRNPDAMGMLTIPGNELSKDNTNSWSESAATGDFNHHNDFFTGRKGQEFATLRESYAYTQALGGMQIINHPGQYWSLDKTYSAGEKNSPEWHAENFRMFNSLIGLEVYNQGNRRPNDRILWDQILNITMPERPVWGYSCDDTHTREQYFRNYEFMLMPELSVDALKEAMKNGSLYFSYEFTGSGEAKAPRINSITVDNTNNTITIDTDADDVSWIYSTDKNPSQGNGSRRSSVVGVGKTFNFSGFQGSYVRALIKNEYGETCTQPFGIVEESTLTITDIVNDDKADLAIFYDLSAKELIVKATESINTVKVYNLAGMCVASAEDCSESITLSLSMLQPGVYVAKATTAQSSATRKIIIK